MFRIARADTDDQNRFHSLPLPYNRRLSPIERSDASVGDPTLPPHLPAIILAGTHETVAMARQFQYDGDISPGNLFPR
jgi:hypothetical protein